VKNVGGETVSNVALEMVEFTPQGADFLPLPMREMNDDTRPFVLSREGVTLQPGRSAYFDIVYKQYSAQAHHAHPVYGLSSTLNEITWCYAHTSRPRPVADGTYRVTLRAYGRDVPTPTEGTFVVSVNSTKELFLIKLTA
jgi:hypothetical protein